MICLKNEKSMILAGSVCLQYQVPWNCLALENGITFEISLSLRLIDLQPLEIILPGGNPSSDVSQHLQSSYSSTLSVSVEIKTRNIGI